MVQTKSLYSKKTEETLKYNFSLKIRPELKIAIFLL